MEKARSGWRRRAAWLVAAALVLAVVAPARGGEATVLGRVCVRDIKALVDKAGKVAEKVVPGAGAQATAAAAMALQGAEWAGVDWSKPVTVVVLSGKAFGKTEPAVVGIFPVTNAEQFQQARQQAGRPNEKFEVRGQFGLVTEDEGAFAAITPKRLQIYSKFPDVGADADVYVTFYISKAVAEYQAEIDMAMQAAQEQVAGMGAEGPFAALAKIQKAVSPLAKLAGKQARRVSMILKLGDESLDITGRLYALPDSQLATFFGGQPAETTDLVKYMPADAAVSMAGKLDLTKLKPLVETVLETLAGPLEMDAEGRQKILNLFFASTQTGEFASAMAGGAAHQGMQSVQIVKIADGAKFRTAAKDGIQWFMSSGLGAMLQGMGMKMDWKQEPGAREHKGVAIDRYTMTLAQAPDAPPNPMMGQVPPQVTEMAAVDTLGMTASNNPDGGLLNAVIDRVQGGEPGLDQSPAYKQARTAAPQDANVIGHVSFNTFVAKMLEEAGKRQPMIAMMTMGIAKADPNEAPITGYARFTQDRVDFFTRIPQEPIVNFATRVRMWIQQQQQGGMRPGGPRPGPRKPGDDDDF